jgi:hypothetical protein
VSVPEVKVGGIDGSAILIAPLSVAPVSITPLMQTPTISEAVSMTDIIFFIIFTSKLIV